MNQCTKVKLKRVCEIFRRKKKHLEIIWFGPFITKWRCILKQAMFLWGGGFSSSFMAFLHFLQSKFDDLKVREHTFCWPKKMDKPIFMVGNGSEIKTNNFLYNFNWMPRNNQIIRYNINGIVQLLTSSAILICKGISVTRNLFRIQSNQYVSNVSTNQKQINSLNKLPLRLCPSSTVSMRIPN